MSKITVFIKYALNYYTLVPLFCFYFLTMLVSFLNGLVNFQLFELSN